MQGLDLSARTEVLLNVGLEGAVFLGCVMEAQAAHRALEQESLVFPRIPDLPYSPYRPRLYTVEELFGGFEPTRPQSYHETLDGRVYAHWKKTGEAAPGSILETLARRIHDHAITDAMMELLHPEGGEERVVAIMGGHSMPRSQGDYLQVARIARELASRGFLMTSGGGPGAMEATHLGAYFADHSDQALQDAVSILEAAPRYSDALWLSKAFEVRERWTPSSATSLGIPTWLYGHEPPNPFATHIAKYFANSVREDGLLAIAKHGVIFSPGSAGTIQEIFQDACQNHYRTHKVVSPMIFWNEAYWSFRKPVYPLLAQLAAGQDYGRYLAITDDPQRVVSLISSYAEQFKT